MSCITRIVLLAGIAARGGAGGERPARTSLDSNLAALWTTVLETPTRGERLRRGRCRLSTCWNLAGTRCAIRCRRTRVLLHRETGHQAVRGQGTRRSAARSKEAGPPKPNCGSVHTTPRRDGGRPDGHCSTASPCRSRWWLRHSCCDIVLPADRIFGHAGRGREGLTVRRVRWSRLLHPAHAGDPHDPRRCSRSGDSFTTTIVVQPRHRRRVHGVVSLIERAADLSRRGRRGRHGFRALAASPRQRLRDSRASSLRIEM